MKDGSTRNLHLTVESRVLQTFLPFLQDGFFLEVRLGCSIREFLMNCCHLSPETIADRISTVFLDGQPVDDLDHAFVEDGCTLALSGAMPGLVGAVMRKNSPLRSFRGSITHGSEKESKTHQPQKGRMRLKLFNTVGSELGPVLLKAGILLEPPAVQNYLEQHSKTSRGGIREILLDHESVEMTRLFAEDAFSGSALVSLSVKVHE